MTDDAFDERIASRRAWRCPLVTDVWASQEIAVDWLEPWSSVEGAEESYREAFRRQLATEVRHGHPLHEVPVELIGRGNGDDCLFAMLDGTNRVAVVHLVWQGPQTPPWPGTTIYEDLDAWRVECMLPEHEEWVEE